MGTYNDGNWQTFQKSECNFTFIHICNVYFNGRRSVRILRTCLKLIHWHFDALLTSTAASSVRISRTRRQILHWHFDALLTSTAAEVYADFDALLTSTTAEVYALRIRLQLLDRYAI